MKRISPLFRPKANTLYRLSLGAIVLVILSWATIWGLLVWSPYITEVGHALEQPIPFSHEHHAGQLGIDCRFCHTSVDKSNFAGMPSSRTCMMCHSQLYTGQEMLKPLRESYDQNKPLHWNRVHDLPDFVYFNHSAHINKGLSCNTCHGDVESMPLTWKSENLYMKWCLDCHRHPEKGLDSDRGLFPVNLNEQNKPQTDRLLDCTTCHR